MKYLILFSLLFSGCANWAEPVSTTTTGNRIQVSLLFENEGCKVYRFVDGDRAHYYTNCSETIVAHTEQQGKTSVTVYENIGSKK